MANDVPVFERKVAVQSTSTPNFQGATEAYADTQNSLGELGAKVAQSANQEMAKDLGYEAGKNPNGNLSPPITDFDKTFEENYHTQAAATLSLQGQSLLDDAQLQMSKASKLTPKLIGDTAHQLTVGLKKISENAPTAIKGKLEETFAAQTMEQTTRYNNKMLTQQREDQVSNLKAALDRNMQTANEFAINGNFKNSAVLVQGSKSMVESGVKTGYIKRDEANIYMQALDQSALSGQYSFFAEQAYRTNTYDEFSKHYAENKPAGMTESQYQATGQAFEAHVNFLQGLRSQNENLETQKMLNQIAADPMSITGTQLKEFQNKVTPLKYSQVEFRYIQAQKALQNKGDGTDALIQNFSSPEAFAIASPKIKNAAYLKQVDYAVKQSQGTANPMSHAEAEVQVAAQAGGTVPVFVNGLKNKLHSSNPAFIEEAAQQIHSLEQMQAGHALDGINDQDKALYTMYESLRDSNDPVTAAKETTAAILNQDPEVQKANQQKWANLISTIAKSIPVTSFALSQFNLKESSFVTPSTAQVYGADIFEKYKSLYQIANGDNNVAKTLTQKYVDNNYGPTGVNGGSFTTMHPIEKTLGFTTTDAVPYIQQDVINQIQPHFDAIKKMYDDKKSNEYWETIPLTKQKHGVFTTSYDPVQIKLHTRTANGEVTDTFPVVLQGNAFNYDVAIQTKSGMRNLFQVAPYLGVLNYTPNSKAIHEAYNKDNSLIPNPNSTMNKTKDYVNQGISIFKKEFITPEHGNQ